jgi:hypothetical protein
LNEISTYEKFYVTFRSNFRQLVQFKLKDLIETKENIFEKTFKEEMQLAKDKGDCANAMNTIEEIDLDFGEE